MPLNFLFVNILFLFLTLPSFSQSRNSDVFHSAGTPYPVVNWPGANTSYGPSSQRTSPAGTLISQPISEGFIINEDVRTITPFGDRCKNLIPFFKKDSIALNSFNKYRVQAGVKRAMYISALVFAISAPLITMNVHNSDQYKTNPNEGMDYAILTSGFTISFACIIGGFIENKKARRNLSKALDLYNSNSKNIDKISCYFR